MKKHLLLYLFMFHSYTQLMANSLYAQLGISPATIQPLPILKEKKREILKQHQIKKEQVNTLSQIFKYVKTKKISEEKSKVGAKINYVISKTVKLELDLITTLHTKALKDIKVKGEEAHFNFSIAL